MSFLLYVMATGQIRLSSENLTQILGSHGSRKTGKIHLLYDYVDLLNYIRNNWLTEKSGEIFFKDEEEKDFVAKWFDLRNLSKAEEKSLVKQSKLNCVSVFPKPIERQNVQACLRVFSEETIVVLKNHEECYNIITMVQ